MRKVDEDERHSPFLNMKLLHLFLPLLSARAEKAGAGEILTRLFSCPAVHENRIETIKTKIQNPGGDFDWDEKEKMQERELKLGRFTSTNTWSGEAGRKC